MRSAAVAIGPITQKVAPVAERNQVGEGVGLFVPLHAERSERRDVVDVKRLPLFLWGFPAVLAHLVSLAGYSHGGAPRRSVVRLNSTSPKEAIRSGTISRICLGLARSRAITAARCLTRFYGKRRFALWARQCGARTWPRLTLAEFRMQLTTNVLRLPVTEAALRAEPFPSSRSRSVDSTALLTGDVRDCSGIVCLRRAGNRTVSSRPTPKVTKHLAAFGARRLGVDRRIGAFARRRAVDARLALVEGVDLLARRADARGFSVRVGSSSGFHKPKYIPHAA